MHEQSPLFWPASHFADSGAVSDDIHTQPRQGPECIHGVLLPSPQFDAAISKVLLVCGCLVSTRAGPGQTTTYLGMYTA